MNGLRRALAVVTLWLPAATILWTWMLWEGRLPANLPTHWGVGGPADGVTSAPAFLGWLLGVSAVLLLVAALCVFRVTVDERGLRITSGLLGIPLKCIAPAKIAAIEVTTLEPMQWGGWGYRIMPGRSAIILRRGPGLVITQHDERQFAITLDEPEEPASTLLALATAEDASAA